jgi:hypothetical protein
MRTVFRHTYLLIEEQESWSHPKYSIDCFYAQRDVISITCVPASGDETEQYVWAPNNWILA